MNDIALLIRAMQFKAHIGHNLAKGPTFYQDHEALGELYPEYDRDYDAAVEAILADDPNLDLAQLHVHAAALLQQIDGDAFEVLLRCEAELRVKIAELMPKADIADQNLLATLAERSKRRAQYKIQRRLAV